MELRIKPLSDAEAQEILDATDRGFNKIMSSKINGMFKEIMEMKIDQINSSTVLIKLCRDFAKKNILNKKHKVYVNVKGERVAKIIDEKENDDKVTKLSVMNEKNIVDALFEQILNNEPTMDFKSELELKRDKMIL